MKKIFLFSLAINLLIAGFIYKKMGIQNNATPELANLFNTNLYKNISLTSISIFDEVQYLLQRFPSDAINRSMLKNQKETNDILKILESYKQTTNHFPDRKNIYTYWSNPQRLDSIHLAIENHFQNLQKTDMAIDSTNQALDIQWEETSDSLDIKVIKQRQLLTQFKNISASDIDALITSIQTEIALKEMSYLHDFKNIIYGRKQNNWAFKPVLYTKNEIHLGDTFNISINIAKYLTDYKFARKLLVNGQEYQFKEDDYIKYEETPTKIGKQKLNLEISMQNQQNNWFRYTSEYEYYVIP